MGNALSRKNLSDAQKFTLLIGNLDRKSPLEQKFYVLSKACLVSKQTSTSQSCHTEAANVENDSMSRVCSENVASEEYGVSVDSCENFKADQTKTSLALSDNKTLESVSDIKIRDLSGNNSSTVTWAETKQNNHTDTENSFFTSILGMKPLCFTQTYRSWHAIMDIEKLFYRNRKTIYLVQLDEMPEFIYNFTINFDNKNVSLYEILRKFIEIFYDGMTVKWLETVNMQQEKWKIKSRIHKKTNKKQHLVKDIFPYLKRICPSDGYSVLALTWTDLYPSEDMNFVLGEASNQQKACVVSFGRWEPKDFDPHTHQDLSAIDTHVLWKLFKTCSHELGHIFGLNHCDFFQCMMNESTSVPEAMSQPMFLCPVCIRKIQNLCKFNILQRYRNLLEFVEKISSALPSEKWTKSCDWLREIVQYLSIDKNSDLELS